MVLTLAVTASVAGAVICLLMLPFPQLSDQSGQRFHALAQGTGVALLLAGVASLSTWLLEKRLRVMWLGQILLLIALAGALVFLLQVV